MKKQNVTISDIAAAAGVSLSTAHLALSGKPGIRPKTKARVLEQARRMDYHCNAVASSLKRGETRIAAVLPARDAGSTMFYEPIWEGIRDYCESVRDFQIHLTELPYQSLGTVSVPSQAVERLRSEQKLAGAVMLGALMPEAKEVLRELLPLPIVLVNGDALESGRICCVQAENYLLGRTMGELLLLRMQKPGGILVCAGDRSTSADREAVDGLEDYLAGVPSGCELHKIYHQNDLEGLYQRLIDTLLHTPDLQGCCSMTARGSLQLAKALKATGLAGNLCAIGSDAFPENIRNLKNGVFQNLMFKNPYRQGWVAAEQLFKHIFSRSAPESDVIRVKSEAIFRSSVQMYESGRRD